jgi:hypothetical protein
MKRLQMKRLQKGCHICIQSGNLSANTTEECKIQMKKT